MKRIQRTPPTFSISALDLFASALGTFVLLTIFLFPFYTNEETQQGQIAHLENALHNSQQTGQQCQQQNAQQQQQIATLNAAQQQLQQQLQTAQVIKKPDGKQLKTCQQAQKQQTRQLQRCQQQKHQCETQLQGTFLTLVLKWTTERQDVDLHVQDPQGNVFFYKKHNRNGVHFKSRAELSVDSVQGPGIEIWEYPQAQVGTYQIYANLYDRVGNIANPVIKTTLYYRGGSKKLPEVTLTQEDKKRLIATIYVSKQGKVSMQ